MALFFVFFGNKIYILTDKICILADKIYMLKAIELMTDTQ